MSGSGKPGNTLPVSGNQVHPVVYGGHMGTVETCWGAGTPTLGQQNEGFHPLMPIAAKPESISPPQLGLTRQSSIFLLEYIKAEGFNKTHRLRV